MARPFLHQDCRVIVSNELGVVSSASATLSVTPIALWGWSPTAPSPPAGLTNLLGIAGGYFHVLVLKTDRTLVSWANVNDPEYYQNNHGQASVPLGLTDVVAIAANRWHNLVLKADGTVISIA